MNAGRSNGRLRGEQGSSIVTAVMVALTVFALGGVWTSIGVHQVESSSFERLREQALHSAEAGINLAISQLAGDDEYAGTTSAVPLADDTGEFEVTVTPLDPTDPEERDFSIVGKGYSPSKTANRRAARRLEQQVRLEPAEGFEFAVFASPGGVTGQNNANINGDVYSASALTLGNQSTIYGDVVARGGVTTTNRTVIGGDVHALGDVSLDNSQTLVQGSVFSSGSVGGTATVGGHVQAGGAVTMDPSLVGGTIKASSPPPHPPLLTQPTFTWTASNYPTSFSWSSASGFMSWWSSNRNSLYAAHRINGGDDASNTATLNQTMTLSGDLTIVSNGPVTLSRDIANSTSETLTLAVISYSTRDPAISFTNNVTLPSNVRILLFAPNGVVDFSQLKDFHGVVYGHTVRLSQYFTLDYDPPNLPGFTWTNAAATRFRVDMRTFREVPFEP
ncbi:MAG TPA: hypothetical protein VM618_11135 [Acidimicrobiia bacterium]|nr:hypothetical protein [Acidimicrobiia bacterium]